MKKIIFLLLLPCFAFAQAPDKHTISGYVKDGSNGEAVLGASVYIKELKKGTSTNQYGFYSLTVEKGTWTLVVSIIGFEDFSQQVTLDKDMRINIPVKPSVITTQEVEINAEKTNKNVTGTEMGTNKLDIEQIKLLPSFMGEVDVLKTIQLLPGVQSAGDGNSGFYVRGGGPDQNLILLDEAVVYNASHLFGFFSIFNSDAIKDVNLIKGGMPANYGGRLSSVLDINMKEGNNKKYEAEGGIGLISSRLTLQGPIKKDTSSFIVSARRTYIDVLMKPFVSKSSPFYGTGYYFYDLNTKINYRLSDKDRLFLSGYFGQDVFNFNRVAEGFQVSIPWGNATTSLRWNHLFSDKLFVNTSAIFSNYKFSFGATQSQFEFTLFSGIRDWNGKVDFSWFPSVRHVVKFGANYIYHTFIPSNASARSGDVTFDVGEIVKLYAHEAALYVNDEFDWTENIKVNCGLRYSYFAQVGPFKRYIKDDLGRNIIDTIFYKNGEKVVDYSSPEPRISVRINTGKSSSVKAGYTFNNQYIHLASISAVSLPTDLWVPCTEIVKPQKGNLYALGYFRNFKKDVFETSVEVYYKDMKNLIEYKEGALPEDNVKDNPDNSFTFGTGYSYGAEFFVKKRTGKLNGWVGYTLSWTNRKFPEINGGKEFPAKWDRRHDVSVALSYDLNKRWTFSTVFVFATGNTITLPISRYIFEGQVLSEYGPRNSYRMAPYDRLDLAATWYPDRQKRLAKKNERLKAKMEKKGLPYEEKPPRKWVKDYTCSWTFSVYNVYNRANPYFIYFETDGEILKGNFSITAKQVSLFPILPSVAWNFKF